MRGRITIFLVSRRRRSAAASPARSPATSRPLRRPVPYQPTVEIISPRNGAVQTSLAVVVKAKVTNFRLAPRHFGKDPELGMGNLRFSLNRVPDCVDPEKLRIAEESPIGRGRLVGASFDFPKYSGPNGLLAEQVGSTGLYSPGPGPRSTTTTSDLASTGWSITLAQNNGETTPFHDVTNFQILPRPGSSGPKPCRNGKISSAKAEGLEYAPGFGLYFTLYSGMVQTFRRLMGFLRPYRRELGVRWLSRGRRWG